MNIVVVVSSEDLYYTPWSARIVYRRDVSDALWTFLTESTIVEFTQHSVKLYTNDALEYSKDYDRAWKEPDVARWGEHAVEIVGFLKAFWTKDSWDNVSGLPCDGKTVGIRFFCLNDR